MNYMLISYATKDWEAGLPPDPRLLVAIPRLSETMPKGSALVGTGGLAPSAMGAKVRVSQGKVVVTDGPFSEAKEIVGGYAIVDVGSKDDAIAIAREFWQLHVDVLGPLLAVVVVTGGTPNRPPLLLDIRAAPWSRTNCSTSP
jgi:hypothetical protein